MHEVPPSRRSDPVEPTIELATGLGPVVLTFLGHASLRIDVAGKVIHVDPWTRQADYDAQPKADQVWITHDHVDHYDEEAIAKVRKASTRFLMNATAARRFAEPCVVLANGASVDVDGVAVTAVPAYNRKRKRANGEPYHPKGEGNGYLARFGDLVVHIGADTECVPELSELGRVDVSMLPINLPPTMPPEEAAECFERIHPRIAVPYHQGDSDPEVVAERLRHTDIDVRVFHLR